MHYFMTGIALSAVAVVGISVPPHQESLPEAVKRLDRELKQTQMALRDSTFVPIGAILAWSGTTAPLGWAICDGSIVDVADTGQRKSLFQLMEGFGVSQSGIGENSIRVPDLRGRFLRGYDRDGRVDKDQRALGSEQSDALARHAHAVTIGESGVHEHAVQVDSNGEHSHGASAALAGRHSHGLVRPLAHYATGGDTDGDPNGSRDAGIVRTDESGDHSHVITVAKNGAHVHTARTVASGTHSHVATCAEAGAASETRPRNVAINWIMRIHN